MNQIHSRFHISGRETIGKNMMLMLVFIIGAVEGQGLLGGFEDIPLTELKNYPEIEKGLEKGMDEYNANLRKEVPHATKRYTDCCFTTIFIHYYIMWHIQAHSIYIIFILYIIHIYGIIMV